MKGKVNRLAVISKKPAEKAGKQRAGKSPKRCRGLKTGRQMSAHKKGGKLQLGWHSRRFGRVRVGRVYTRELMRKWRTGEQVEGAGECERSGLVMEFVVKNKNSL